MMKIHYSNILNSMSGDLSANEAGHTAPEISEKEDCAEPETRYSIPSDYNDLDGKSTQKVYLLIINADNCANLQLKRLWTDI